MKHGRASSTAALVAAWRGFASFLPEPFRSLAPDPFGIALAGAPYTWLAALLARFPRLATFLLSPGGLLRGFTGSVAAPLYMAVRTRTIDDALRRFVRAGGRQVILLGAGLDARALRLRGELGASVTFFEVDHPDTQKQKRLLLVGVTRTSAHVDAMNAIRFVAHDFETGVRTALPSKLADAGFDASQRCFVVWEGVVMYLSAEAVTDTVSFLRDTIAARSQLSITYMSPAAKTAPMILPGYLRWLWLLWLRLYAREPFRFYGWQPAELPAWLEARGFKMLEDESYNEVAGRMGVVNDALAKHCMWARFALAERVGSSPTK